MILLLLILVPLLASLAMLLPIGWFNGRRNAWGYALGVSGVTFVLALIAAISVRWVGTTAFTPQINVPWVPSLGLHFGVGVDAISMWLVLLSAFLMPLVVLASYSSVTEKAREYYFWLTILLAAMIGVFLATDILFFYICFEFTLIPLYFLISIYGSSGRMRAARYFFLYTFAGSMLTFAGVLYVVAQAGSFQISELYPVAAAMSYTEQALVLFALLAGFAVKVPLFPVHTWLPLAHTEAPTAGSVILAGVLLKLGTYGILRFALPMCPEAVVAFAPWVATLAIVGILYAALICWVQRDVKKLVAYSSVSHLGFCVLGLFALDAQDIGAIGAVLYMINHGLSTGALFLCIGMIYERFHTREMAAMSGLAKAMPVWAFFMVFFVLASVGLPGLNGFPGEFLTLMGAALSGEVLGLGFAAVAGVGMILAAIYLLYLTGRIVFGPSVTPHVDPAFARNDDHREHHHHHARPRDLSWREIGVLSPIAVACVLLGTFAVSPMIDSLEPAVAQMTAGARTVVAERSAPLPDEHRIPHIAAAEE